MDEDLEVQLQGAPVSEGIAMGVPYFLMALSEESIPEFPITMGEVDGEIERYRRALFSSREDLERLQVDLESEGSTDAVTIIDTHIQMLKDPLMTTDMEARIRTMQRNTESVFRSAICDYEKKFSQTSDSFFQQRLIDVMDVSKRILGHLCPKDKAPFGELPHNAVVFAEELNPSYTAGVSASRVRALVTRFGGGNSHAAVIARAKGIPFVTSIDMQLLQNASWVIVDGVTGEVIINPTSETIEKYKESEKRLQARCQLLEGEGHLSAHTIDGQEIALYINVGNLGDLDGLHRQGIRGVGLYRSEYLILENPTLIYSEEEQYQEYAQALRAAQGLPVVIRVFDIGGDKHFSLFIEEPKEQNPVLGCRGIRFLLRFKALFKTQLRALLRASCEGDMRLLLPLISDVDELRQTKQLIEVVKAELAEEGLLFKTTIPIGCMIEVPSAVLISDLLAQECDFFSLGTNDLVQYALGIDRSNPLMGDAHPSVIRLMKMAIGVAKKYQKPLSICGEIASNPLFVPLLVGLGIDELSCAPRYIPAIKRVVRRCTLQNAQEFAQRILRLSTFAEISQALMEESRRLFPEDA